MLELLMWVARTASTLGTPGESPPGRVTAVCGRSCVRGRVQTELGSLLPSPKGMDPSGHAHTSTCPPAGIQACGCLLSSARPSASCMPLPWCLPAARQAAGWSGWRPAPAQLLAAGDVEPGAPRAPCAVRDTRRRRPRSCNSCPNRPSHHAISDQQECSSWAYNGNFGPSCGTPAAA